MPMHRLIRIKVLRDFDRLEERVRCWMDNIFDFQEAGASFRPPVDLFETAQGLVLRMELAGVTLEDLSLTLCGQELVIRGQRRPFLLEGVTRFLRHEIGCGVFERRFLIPASIDPEGLQARYAEGILEVTLPRRVPSSRRIPVQETE
jgi:HSP20 family protein